MGNIEKWLYAAHREHRRILALLLDPDTYSLEEIPGILAHANRAGVQLILVGGSLMLSSHLDEFVAKVKMETGLPVLLFPGNAIQISKRADGILFLSLISGRNPEFLIGQQVVAAPFLHNSRLEILPTGYMLIDGGKETTASYISASKPIPYDKPDIALATALAGNMLGQRVLYMDTGSGANRTVPGVFIKKISENLNVPLIVGGGIRTEEDLQAVYASGATVAVIGTVAEQTPDILHRFREVVEYQPAKWK